MKPWESLKVCPNWGLESLAIDAEEVVKTIEVILHDAATSADFANMLLELRSNLSNQIQEINSNGPQNLC